MKFHAMIEQYAIIVVLLCSMVTYATAKTYVASHQVTMKSALLTSGPSSSSFQSIVAGPCLGLAADVNLISIFSVHDILTKKDLSVENKEAAWSYLYQYLLRAQYFDPWFWDIYRLTIGMLAFNENYTERAIMITKTGSEARYWDWEPPFLAGFLAYDMLHDNELAVSLMKSAATRSGAPPMLVGVAAKILAKSSGPKESKAFLLMMKRLMPKGYSDYIDSRISKLEMQKEE